ncbi:cyclic nucleotide-binding domain-containing protein [Labilibaculum sp. A4]|uniref:Crp/Fnr family transcriptional regulator n=1 Tax=Labilibaculum euxinus TaxID=2686357 RepID=UPI000F62401F|nr:Crp/Fnr family transcriptional regulator [Labilibaculum euxinus]MDQ1771358.1 Crp/Fnr family transcriptional regulator [Labilibaculum euxinus]MWN77146.1 cyclic nucleotide-binding domain-containing protein [Labilibaculum euxinus]
MIENDRKSREIICGEVINNSSSVFNVLTPSEKEELMANMTCSFFKKGEYIYKEGERPIGLICLSEGKVKIFKEGVGGREQIVRMAKPIGFIGYRALFAEENNIASAVAIEDSITCTVSYELMLKFIKPNSDLSLCIIRSLSTELGFSNNRTITLTQKHIRGRLAESLLFLRDTYGFEDDEATIKVYLSREDIANLSNMTTSNAIRTLSTFASEGIISIDGRKIKILDKVRLDRVSKLG